MTEVLVVTPGGSPSTGAATGSGRGGGYYDGFLRAARARSTLTALGVCLSVQLVEEAPHDARDQRVDGIVTEEELILLA